MKKVTITIEIEDEEYEEFLDGELVQGNLHEFLFAELCQNQGFGFITGLEVEDLKEEK